MSGETEYRVAWKREGLRKKERIYKKLSSAERFMSILANTRTLHDFDCADRDVACDCGPPDIEWVRVETRQTGPWEQVPDEIQALKQALAASYEALSIDKEEVGH